MLQFVLEAPWWCTILCFLFNKLWWDNLLVQSFCWSIRSKCEECYWTLCTFKSTKHTTKESDGLHNHSTLSTTIMCPFFPLYNAHSCLFFSLPACSNRWVGFKGTIMQIFLNKLYCFGMFFLTIFFSEAKLKTAPSMGVACRKLWAPDKT